MVLKINRFLNNLLNICLKSYYMRFTTSSCDAKNLEMETFSYLVRRQHGI